MSIVTVMLASVAGLSLTPVAAHEDRVVENTRIINYAPEILRTDEGVEHIRRLIANSARTVCQENGRIYTRLDPETRRCVDNAYRDGIEQLQIKVAEARQVSRSYAQTLINPEAVTY